MVNLALIGLGQMGKNYLKTAGNFRGIKIKYICSKTQKSLDNFPQTYIKITKFQNLASIPDLAGVIIATPSSSHYEIAKFFIKRKIPILIEKPLTTNYNQALKLLKLQNQTHSKVIVGHTLLFYPEIQKIKKIVKEIKSLKFIGANNNPRSDTSIIWDWGPHGVSLCLFLYQALPKYLKFLSTKLNKKIDYIDQATIEMGYDSGIKFTTDMAWNSLKKIRRFEIKTEQALIKFDDFENPKLKIVNNQNKTSYISLKPVPPLHLELKAFVDLIKKNKNSQSDLAFGVKVTKTLSLLEKSFLLNGKPITFT